MRNRLKFLGIVVMIAAIGLSMAGCDNPSGNDSSANAGGGGNVGGGDTGGGGGTGGGGTGGGGGAGGGGGGAAGPTTIFSLATHPAAATSGPFNAGHGLQSSASGPTTTVSWTSGTGGAPAILLSGRSNQSEGIDLMNYVFNFRAGDIVTVTARISPVAEWAEIIQNVNTADWAERGQTGDASNGNVVTSVYTVTAADLNMIRGANPAAIRIQTNYADHANLTILNITIQRP